MTNESGRRSGVEEAGGGAVIDVRGLRMRYGSVDVLKGVEFTACRGEVLALLGPNGAGKTTTIEILEGFRMRSAGEVRVLGVDPAKGDERWRARIGVVLQSWRDHGKWRVRELLAHLGRYYAPYSTQGHKRPYLVGKIVQITGMSLVSLVTVLIPGALLFGGLRLGSPGGWFTLVWVLLLGLVATMPIGAVLGSLFSSPSSLGFVFVPMMGLIAISGIFYPITVFPVWLQWIGQVFPIYWVGLGMRSAFLPDSLASVEIGDSWRHLETAGVLGVWAIVGLVLAPIVLRRMARRESGSTVDARREKAMLRSGW